MKPQTAIKGFILLLCVLCSHTLWANCGSNSMNRAREAYDIGKFTEAIGILQECLGSDYFNQSQKVAAFRIIAVSYIEIDSIDQAIRYANELITLEPSFPTRPEDPLRFQQLIADIRQGQLSRLISSVSKTNENSAEAPATVIVITAEEIAQRGYQSIMDALVDLPGFDITLGRGVTYGMVYQRGYRSILTDRTLFLVDGVEENDLSSDHAFISRQYAMSNIKRIEVIYGPTSTMYGANAFVGVINIVTKDGTEMIKQGNSFGVNGSVAYGSLNTKMIDVTVAARHKNLSLITAARIFQSDQMDLSKMDNWDYWNDSDELYTSRLSTKTPARLNALNTTYKADSGVYYIIENGIAKPTAAGIERARRLDNNALDTILDGNPISAHNEVKAWSMYTKLRISDFTLCYQTWYRREANVGWFNTRHAGSDNGGVWLPKNSFIYLKYEKDLSEKLALTIFTQYKAHELSEETAFVTLASYRNGGADILGLMKNVQPRWSTRYFFRISKQLRNEMRLVYTSKRLSTVFGGEFRNSLIQGDYLSSYDIEITPSQNGLPDTLNAGNFSNQRDLGVYLQSSYFISKDVKLTLGGRIDNNRLRSNLGYGTVFNPRIAIVYSPGQFIFKALYAKAFKQPSHFTRYSSTSTRTPAPNLQNETVQNFEVSAHWESKDQRFTTEIVAYYASYEGIVGTGKDPKDSLKSQFKNLGTSLIQGVQATAHYKYKNYTIFGNYSFCHPFTTEDKSASEGKSLRISDIASHHLNLGANALFMKVLNVNVRMNYVGKRLVGSGTSTENTNKLITEIPAYTVINSSVSYSPKQLPSAHIQLTINNLLGNQYNHPGIREADNVTYTPLLPQLGRTFTLTLGYTF